MTAPPLNPPNNTPVPLNTPTPPDVEAAKKKADEEARQLMIRVVGEQERAKKKLEQENADLRAKLEASIAAPKPTDADKNKKYFADPVGTLREIMAETVKPLEEYVGTLKATDAATQIKNNLRADSRYTSRFPIVEKYLDEALVQHVQKGGTITYDSVQNILIGVIGLVATDQIPGVTFNAPAPVPPIDSPPAPPTREPTLITPPHLMPSNAPPAPSSQKPKVRELSENERLLARQHNMTAEQYIEGIGAEQGNPMVIHTPTSVELRAARLAKRGNK